MRVLINFLAILLFVSIAKSYEDVGKLPVSSNSYTNVLKATEGDAIYAGTWGDGVLLSTNKASSWSQRSSGLTNLYINDIAIGANRMFVATNGGGAYYSDNGGNNWNLMPLDTNLNITAIAVDPTDNNYVYAGTYGDGVFMSEDGGSTWMPSNTSNDPEVSLENIETLHITVLEVTPTGTILAGTYGDGLFRSEDRGQNWRGANSGTNATKYINDIYIAQANRIYLATNDRGVFESNNDGRQWSRWFVQEESELVDLAIPTVAYTGDVNDVIVGTRESGIWYYNTQPYQNFRKSNFRKYGVTDIEVLSDGTLIAAMTSEGVIRSTDNAETWERVSLRADFNQSMNTVAYDNYVMLIDQNGTLFRSSDYGLNFNQVTSYSGGNFLEYKVAGNNLIFQSESAMITSTDNGDNWTDISPPLVNNDDEVLSFDVAPNGDIYAAVLFLVLTGNPPEIDEIKIDIYQSTDLGQNWTKKSEIENGSKGKLTVSSLGDLYLWNIISDPENGDSYSILKSTDNGTTFTPTPYDVESQVNKMDWDFNTLFVCTSDGFFYSKNNGTSFSEYVINIERPQNMPNPSPFFRGYVAKSADEIYAAYGSGWGLYKTEDGGTTWDSLNASFNVNDIIDITINEDGDIYFASQIFYRSLNGDNMGVPALTSPENGATDVDLESVVVDWEESEKAELYEVNVASNETFGFTFEKIILAPTEREIFYDLEYNTTYYWRVRGKTNGSLSPWSQEFTFTTEIAPPNLVSPADSSEAVPHLPEFVWESVDGGDYYKLEISSSEDFSTIDVVVDSLTDTSHVLLEENRLNPVTQYWWRVQAYNEESDSDYSEEWTFKTLIGAPQLRSPEDEATNQPIEITFQWDEVEEGDEYEIQISRFEDFSIPIFDSRTENNTSQFFDNLEYNVTYFWRIRGVDIDGNEGPWSETWAFSTNLASPTLISPANNSGNNPNTLTLTWEDMGDVSYLLQVDINDTFSNPFVDETLTENEYELTDLSTNQTYFWRVKVVVDDAESQWTEPFNFSTGMPRTVLVSPANETVDQSVESVLLEWEDTEGAESYQVQLSLNNSFTNFVLDESDVSLSRKDFYDLEYNTTYWWRVKAFNENGDNGWSEVWRFTTELNTSVYRNAEETSMNIYPNPVNNYIMLDINDEFTSESVTFEIRDASGAIVKTISGNSNSKEINVSEIGSGNYFLIITGNKKKYVHRFIIVK